MQSIRTNVVTFHRIVVLKDNAILVQLRYSCQEFDGTKRYEFIIQRFE